MISFFILFGTFAHSDVNPPGTFFEDALLLDVPEDGFDAITEFIPALLPERIDVDGFSDGYGGLFGQCWLGGYGFSLSNLWVSLNINNATITPADGYLEMEVKLDVSLNDSSDPFQLETELECISSSCNGRVEPFETDVVAQIFLDVIDDDGDGLNELDASIQNISFNYDLEADNIVLEDCAIGTLEDVLNFIGLSMYDLILGIARPELENQIYTLIPELEQTIEDAFSSAIIDEEVDLNGSAIRIQLSPSDIDIKEEGMRIMMGGAAQSPTIADCVVNNNPGGSKLTAGDLPEIGELQQNFHVLALAKDDFINQALYSIWQAGVLCYTIDEEVFALDTGILNLLTEDSFLEMFPETEPMEIVTSPKKAPELLMDSDSDLAVDVQELGLQFYAEVDYREANVIEVDLFTDVGIGLDLDPVTGVLDIGLDLDPDRIKAVVYKNEFTPEKNGTIEENFGSQMEVILNVLDLDALLSDLNFALPSVSGMGITQINAEASGTTNEDLGLMVQVGPVEYQSGGCGEEGGEGGCGEGGDGCSGGGGSCSTGSRVTGRSLLGFMVLALAMRRRHFST